MRILKIAAWLLLVLTGREVSAACVESKVKGMGDQCDERESPFQPCSDFELIAGRATQSTTMWLLGELHAYKDLTMQCIEKLTKNRGKHIVYLEGTEAGTVVSCEERGFKKNADRTCMGMDDMQAYHELWGPIPPEVFEKAVMQSLLVKLYLLHEGQSEKTILDSLRKAKKRYQKMKKEHEALHKPLPENIYVPEMLKTLDWLLLGHLENGTSFSDLFAKRHRYVDDAIMMTDPAKIRPANNSKAINHRRNVAQITLLAKHPKDTLGFACSGLNHVDTGDQSDKAADSRYVNTEMANGPHKDSYAILRMKAR
ncbi:MAG TPA: hypothetical protein VLJ15_06780 [Gammaproteobacteria bacterium]|nr:hypothetical protein [Gammaproteobacteria bacterium]